MVETNGACLLRLRLLAGRKRSAKLELALPPPLFVVAAVSSPLVRTHPLTHPPARPSTHTHTHTVLTYLPADLGRVLSQLPDVPSEIVKWGRQSR
jgi:hypothetical protein